MIRRSIAVLMTCHNRREKTVACVASLLAAARSTADRVALSIYLVDDGSTDGTADAVRGVAPAARIIEGSGALFWNGGMHRAFAAAMADGHDLYLWLNDDVVLFADALERLLAAWDAKAGGGAAPIVVGATRDSGGRTSYGGVARPSAWKRTSFRRMPATETAARAETFNGNCVLIPAAVASLLGNLDPRFVHQMGDLDYGLRATEAGVPIWVAPGHVGLCETNAPAAAALPRAEQWRKLTSKKNLPPAVWRLFCRRHAGPGWPLFWAWPYVRTALLPRAS